MFVVWWINDKFRWIFQSVSQPYSGNENQSCANRSWTWKNSQDFQRERNNKLFKDPVVLPWVPEAFHVLMSSAKGRRQQSSLLQFFWCSCLRPNNVRKNLWYPGYCCVVWPWIWIHTSCSIVWCSVPTELTRGVSYCTSVLWVSCEPTLHCIWP